MLVSEAQEEDGCVSAVFQSNQNDRVTLERQRENIFLASHPPRDALLPGFSLFFPSSSFLVFFAQILSAWLL